MGKVTNYIHLPDGFVMQVGEYAFTNTTATLTVEVPTKLQTLIATIATPESYSGAAANGAEVLFCDKTITSGAVTVARKVEADADVKFSYIFIGTYGAVGGIGAVTA